MARPPDPDIMPSRRGQRIGSCCSGHHRATSVEADRLGEACHRRTALAGLSDDNRRPLCWTPPTEGSSAPAVVMIW